MAGHPGVALAPSRPGRRRWQRAALAATLAGLLPPSARGGVPAPRCVAVDWAAAETLVQLGVMPLGVPELEVYRAWLPQSALAPATVDLGARTEPNFEVLAALAPQRIFVSGWQKTLLPRFERIAATEVVTIFDARRAPYAQIRQLMARIGRVAGREAAAAAYVAAFDAELDALARGLAGVRGRRVYVAVLHENGAQAFIYGNGSWVDTVLSRLGMENALRGPTSNYGNALVNIAAFAADTGAFLLYLDQGDRTRRAERLLRGSSLWSNLPAVRQGRALRIPSFYALGGMPSALRCARLLAAALGGAAAPEPRT